MIPLQNDRIHRIRNQQTLERLRRRRDVIDTDRGDLYLALVNFRHQRETFPERQNELIQTFNNLKQLIPELNNFNEFNDMVLLILINYINDETNDMNTRLMANNFLNNREFLLQNNLDVIQNHINEIQIELKHRFINSSVLETTADIEMLNGIVRNIRVHNVDNIINKLESIINFYENIPNALDVIRQMFFIKSRTFDKFNNELKMNIAQRILLNVRKPIIEIDTIDYDFRIFINEVAVPDELIYRKFLKLFKLLMQVRANPLLYFKIYEIFNNKEINLNLLKDDVKRNIFESCRAIRDFSTIMNIVFNIFNNWQEHHIININHLDIFYDSYNNYIDNNIIDIGFFRDNYNLFRNIQNRSMFFYFLNDLSRIFNEYINRLENIIIQIGYINDGLNNMVERVLILINGPIEFTCSIHNIQMESQEEINNYRNIQEQLNLILHGSVINRQTVNDFNLIDHNIRYFHTMTMYIVGIFESMMNIEDLRQFKRNMRLDLFLTTYYVGKIVINFKNYEFFDNDANIHNYYDFINKGEFVQRVFYDIDKILICLNIREEHLIIKVIINIEHANGQIEKRAKYYTYTHFLYGLSIDYIRNNDAEWDDTWDFDYNNCRYFPNLMDVECIEIYNINHNIIYNNDVNINAREFTLLANPLLDIIKRREGMFFDHYIKNEYSFLERYLEEFQIYTKDNIKNEVNCFINCLIQSKLVDKNIINEIRYKIIDQNISFKKIKEISQQYKLNIKITYDKRTEEYYFSDNKENIINLYLYRGKHFQHYMLNKKTLITRYFIENINELIKLNKSYDFIVSINDCSNGKYVSRKNRGMKTSLLIPLLIEKKILIPLSSKDLITKLSYMTKYFELDIPHNIESQSRLIKAKQKKKDIIIEEKIYFADTECFTQDGVHKAYCICFIELNSSEIKCYYGEKCLIAFLKYMANQDKKVIIYFHNLSYDFRMFYMFQINKTIEKNNKVYYAEILWLDNNAKLKIIKFKDSLCMINTALSNFHSWFNLEGSYEKEIYPYNYYTKETYEIGIIENCWIKEKPIWNESKINQFKENLIKLNLIYEDNIHFNSREYCIYYCKRDVKILKEGWIKFRKMFKETLELDIHESLTISALAYKYIKSKSLFNENIYEYGLLLRDWIRQSIIGGRCMTRDNESYYIEEEIYDYDACSLYPSAMKRLFLPTGIPNKIPDELLNFDLLNSLTMSENQIIATKDKYISCYIVEIEITEIGIERHFPLITLKDEKGGNLNINKLGKMFVSNITLEDLIKFQKIKFKIIKGVYWTGNKSSKLSETIQYLYDFRLRLKKEKNPAQICIKELMNSSYGKTIQKPVLTEIIYKHSKEDFLKYLLINSLHIENTYEININCYKIIKKIDEDNFYAPTLIGSLILAMSKRIMNEVICLGEDLDCKIYYQDTDSIHINKNDLIKLESEYEKIYKRKLRGTNMGQFHPDFEEITPGITPHAIKSIFIGKKIYIDKLIDETNNINYHFRMKGIPPVCIREKAKELYGDLNGEELIKLYEKRYYGEKIKFSLSDFKPCFKMSKDFHVINNDSFERII